ncbi:YopX family protein [Leuconostoc citreum]|uniref:YopX family protein n=1 Tax=Leuconostoc citreum TaxID=33964 RepID=UPI001C1F5482|nr:YopX family protein [Leuconostoc citreum]MBU7450677.1 hypothetical protein [Leuconostoc citreum]
MREIKFRAWDKFTGTMVNVATLDFGAIGAECAVDDSGINGDLTSEWILEQYTGLKDVNGVEIYEGDVVKLYAEVHDTFGFEITKKETGKIVFYAGSFFISNGISDEPIYAYENDFEVIGNIHEQPELLEEK